MDYYDDARNYFKYFNLYEEKSDQVSYRLLGRAEDCLNLALLQFEKMEAISANLDKHEHGTIQERMAFLEYFACIETFINQAHKFYLMIGRFSNRINSQKINDVIIDQKSFFTEKIRKIRNAEEHIDERIDNDHPYVSQKGIIIDGLISTQYGEISTNPEEIIPMKYAWHIVLKETEKYLADRVDIVDKIHTAFRRGATDIKPD